MQLVADSGDDEVETEDTAVGRGAGAFHFQEVGGVIGIVATDELEGIVLAVAVRVVDACVDEIAEEAHFPGIGKQIAVAVGDDRKGDGALLARPSLAAKVKLSGPE
jgi:hypothetical protein